jgi:hypothetical protein
VESVTLSGWLLYVRIPPRFGCHSLLTHHRYHQMIPQEFQEPSRRIGVPAQCSVGASRNWPYQVSRGVHDLDVQVDGVVWRVQLEPLVVELVGQPRVQRDLDWAERHLGLGPRHRWAPVG